MTDYEWLTEMGLCHKCRRNKVAPGKKFCFDCLDENRKYCRMRYNPDKAKEYQKHRRETYQRKKASGICIRCSKTATHGMYCYECSIKVKRRSQERVEENKRKRHERGLIPDSRKENGLCRWCGEVALPGLQCCERHRKIFSESGKKAREKDKEVDGYWRVQKAKRLENTSLMKNEQKIQ